jgi:glycosyltransferase involved in cell wall biosynthesis
MPERPWPQAVVAGLPPLDTAAVAADYCARRAIPFIVDVIDPWPDALVDLLPPPARHVGRVLGAPLARRARRIFAAAHAATALSNRYAAWAEQLAAPRPLAAAVFHPAVDIEAFDALVASGDAGRDVADTRPLRAVYAGALARAYDLDCAIDAARILHQDGSPAIEFLIAGDGPERGRLERRADDLPNVRFLGWLDAPALARALSSSDLGLACYRRGASQTVTYKLFEYAAAGLPLVCSLRGEMGEMIERERIGWLYPPERPVELARLLRERAVQREDLARAAVRARQFAQTAGDARRVYGAMAELVELAGRPAIGASA